MHGVFPAVNDELLWIIKHHLTKLTFDRLRLSGTSTSLILCGSTSILVPVTPSASTSIWGSLDCLDSLVVKLVLEGKGSFVARLEMLLPTIVYSTWEHKLHLGDLSQVVLLVFDDADDVLPTALTKAIGDRLVVVVC